VATTKTRSPRAKKVQEADAAAVMASVENLSEEQIRQDGADTRAAIERELGDVESFRIAQLKQRDALTQAISLHETRLTEVHNVEAKLITLDELENQIEDAKERANKAAEDRATEWDSQDADRTTEVARLSEAAKFNHEQTVKQFSTRYKATTEEQQRTERIRQEDLERSWAEREAKIAEQEDENAEMKAKIEGHDAETEAKVAAAKEETEASTKAQFEHLLALAKKDSEAAQTLASQQMAADAKAMAGLREQIVAGATAMETTRSDALELAKQSFVRDSDAKALKAVQEANKAAAGKR
jgi:hypothetical protein